MITKGKWKINFGRIVPEAPLFGFTINVEGKQHSIVNAACYETTGYATSEGMSEEIAKEFYTQEEIKANAELICEAGNVYNETGLTPRQLLTQRNELLEALKGMVAEFTQNDYEIWCDHSVGICACNAINTLQIAQEAINKTAIQNTK